MKNSTRKFMFPFFNIYYCLFFLLFFVSAVSARNLADPQKKIDIPIQNKTDLVTPANKSAVFRLHLNQEPNSLSPLKQKNSSAGYFFQQIYRSLLKFENGKLTGDLAEKCIYKTSSKIECHLKKNIFFSDGSPIYAKHFLKTFTSFLNPENPAFRADLLFEIKNAKNILEKKAEISALGVLAVSNYEIIFELEKPNREYIYNLSSTLLTPTPEGAFQSITLATQQITSGPFKISEWNLGQYIILEPNPYYWKINKERPKIKFTFINEDTVALRTYETMGLDFLRRLPTPYFEKYKNSPERLKIPVFRFDYFAINNQITNPVDKNKKLIIPLSLRKALIFSLNYQSLQKLYESTEPPGCPGLPAVLLDPKIKLCYSMDLKLALNELKNYQQTDPSTMQALKTNNSSLVSVQQLKFIYSKQGGEDHKRTADWLMSQWKENLNLFIPTESQENKIFVTNLEQDPPSLFRKGLSPERPTCAAVLENFLPDHPENYLKMNLKDLPLIVSKMLQVERSNSGSIYSKNKPLQKLCSEGLEIIKNSFQVIPTGPIYFSMLLKKSWTGLKINELNQMDLSDLKFVL